MQTYRALIVALALAVLVGCSAREKDLEKQVKDLENQLISQKAAAAAHEKIWGEAMAYMKKLEAEAKEQYSSRQAELDAKAREAAISAGCRLIFNLCPTSITTPGDLAASEGVSGGSSWVFWGVFLAKILPFAFSIAVLLELWTRRFKPNLDENQTAKLELDAIRAEAVSIESEKETAARAIEDLKIELSSLDLRLKSAQSNLQNELQSIQNQRAEAKEELEKVKAEVQSAKVTKSALDSFNF